jgi:hypothetical protein
MMVRKTRVVLRIVAASTVAVLLMGRPAFAQGATGTGTAAGREVRVTTVGGARFIGKLVSLTPTDVVIQQRGNARDTRLILANVTLVETVHHNTRWLVSAGALTGALIALSSDLCGTGRLYAATGPTGEPDCITAKPLLLIGGFGGLGALIGRKLDRKQRQVLYPATSRGPSVSAGPLPVRKGLGFAGTVRW